MQHNISFSYGFQTLWLKVNRKVNFTWKVNVICWVSAERTSRRSGNRKADLHISFQWCWFFSNQGNQLPLEPEASIAGNYSGWASVCDCAWAFCRWDAWQPGFPPSYERTPNQRPSIAEQLVLYSVTIKTNIFGHDCKSAHVWLFSFQKSKDSVHVTKYE